MKRQGILLLASAALLAGCGAPEVKCNDEAHYMTAAPGRHIEVPEGMDALPKEREMTIPEASPQAPPPPGACIDAPPRLRTGDSD